MLPPPSACPPEPSTCALRLPTVALVRGTLLLLAFSAAATISSCGWSDAALGRCGLAAVPPVMFAAQSAWNAAQVIGVSLAFVFALEDSGTFLWRRALLGFLVPALIFTHYVTNLMSPSFGLALAASLIPAAKDSPDIELRLSPSTLSLGEGEHSIMNHRWLTTIVMVLSAMYNFRIDPSFPYLWYVMAWIDPAAAPQDMVGKFFSTLMVDGRLPPHLPSTGTEPKGPAVCFIVMWAYIPLLNGVYFIYLALKQKGLPRGLCFYGVFHMLFVTDFIDYFYGRGFKFSPHADLAHISERFVWRISMVLALMNISGDVAFVGGPLRHLREASGLLLLALAAKHIHAFWMGTPYEGNGYREGVALVAVFAAVAAVTLPAQEMRFCRTTTGHLVPRVTKVS